MSAFIEYPALPELDLEWLLAPTDTRLFIEQYWEREILHIRQQTPGEISRLFTVDDLDTLLRLHGSRMEEKVRCYDHGKQLLKDEQSNKDTRLNVLSILANGGSVIVNEMEKHWLPVTEIHRRFENSLHCRVQVNAYMTPRDSFAFNAHYDTHDVFVLQTQGEKRWTFFESEVELPLASQFRAVDQRKLRRVSEYCLQPGDVLYVPRGKIHQAECVDGISVHLTAGFVGRLFKDVMIEIVEQLAASDVRWRTSTAGKTIDDARAIVSELMEGALERLTDGVVCETAMKSMIQTFIGTRSLPAMRFPRFMGAEVSENDTVARRADCLWYLAPSDDGEQIEFSYPGSCNDGRPRAMSNPAFMRESFRFIASTAGSFTAAQVPGQFPTALKLILVRNLIEAGLLQKMEEDVE